MMGLNIERVGMVTAVGFDAPASCAAMRAGLDGFSSSHFLFDGDFIQTASVPLPTAQRGHAKLVTMAAMVIRECLSGLPSGRPADTALVLCLAESERPGLKQSSTAHTVSEIRRAVGSDRLAAGVKCIERGALGGIDALLWADAALAAGPIQRCIIVGVDSYLQAQTLEAFWRRRTLFTKANRDGQLPGEGAAALLVTRLRSERDPFQCIGIGCGTERAATDEAVPLRADGLVQAYKAAFAQAEIGYEDLDYRITDISGERNAFKEASLVLSRTMRVRKHEFDLWHTADSVGRVGAATVPLTLGVAWTAARKQYAPGPGVLCHFADEYGARAAVVLKDSAQKRAPQTLGAVFR